MIHSGSMPLPAGGKVLLTGASGMIGSAIRSEFSGRRIQTLQLSRSTVDPGRGNGADAARSLQYVAVSISGEIPWNIRATPAVARPELLEGLSAAIHLSGASLAAHRWTPGYKKEIVSSRVESTRVLAQTLAGLQHPPKALLVASAVGIYGHRGDEVLNEESSKGEGFISDLCRDWEAAAQPAVEAGIRVAYLRFGVALDGRGGALKKMLPLFRWGLGGRLGSGKQWMSWIAIQDLAAAAAFLVERDDLTGAFNMTAPNPVTNAEFARALGRRLHRPAVVPAPTAALRAMMGEVAEEVLLASQRAVPARLSAAGFRFAYPEIDKALEAVLARRG